MSCNKLKESKIIDDNEVNKVKVKQYFKTVVDKVEKNTKIGEITNIQKIGMGIEVKEATDIFNDEEEIKVRVVENKNYKLR